MKRRSPTFKEALVCEGCGATTLRRGAMQKYCATCSGARDRQRKLSWAKKNPRPVNYEQRRESIQRRKELGVDASTENRAEILWDASENPDLSHMLRIAVPFSGLFSKNAIWSMAGGHVYIRDEINNLRDELVYRIRQDHREWFDGKVWIDLFVEKPNARSDAVNVIDLVCDAVKEAIGVDDRWFCIRRLDWSVVKDNPRIYIGVGQEVTEHHRVCSYCGRILPLSTGFGKNKAVRHGHSRTCFECSRSVARAAKAGRKEKVA